MDSKWVYKTIYNNDGNVERHKARFVAKGFMQRYIDYEETFAPITRQETIRMVLALVAQKGWTVHHLDVKNAFLNGYTDEEMFVHNLKVLRSKAKKIISTIEESFVWP